MNSRASSSSSSYEWDVFISFRGTDTRMTFTGNLHNALLRKGIKAFMDKNLNLGGEIASTLKMTIKESRIALVVFSKNYASSTFCLEELANIMECLRYNGMWVCPIFYEVDPSDVRHQKGSYAEALAEHEDRFEIKENKVKKWRTALTDAANLAGLHFKSNGDRFEHDFIDEIIEKISGLLDLYFPETNENQISKPSKPLIPPNPKLSSPVSSPGYYPAFLAEKSMATPALDKETTKKVKRQVEYYLSDSNLLTDLFMRKTIAESEDGMVSLALLCSFNKMRKHLNLGDIKPDQVSEDTVNAVAQVLRNSASLKVSVDGKKVGRTTELPNVEEKLKPHSSGFTYQTEHSPVKRVHNYKQPKPQSFSFSYKKEHLPDKGVHTNKQPKPQSSSFTYQIEHLPDKRVHTNKSSFSYEVSVDGDWGGYIPGADPNVMPRYPYHPQQMMHAMMNPERAIWNNISPPMMFARPPMAVNYIYPPLYTYPPPPPSELYSFSRDDEEERDD